jgi:hypothetical protein
MSRERPGQGCYEFTFQAALPVPAGAQVALEDYARALARAAAAALITGSDLSGVQGVHLCGAEAAPDDSVREDVEAFARELVARAGDGLGWS